MSNEIKTLELKIKKIKKELADLGDMRPGSLTLQSKGRDKKYWQLSYTHMGRGRTEYVSDEFVDEVNEQISNYKKFRVLIDELVSASIDYSRIKMGQVKIGK